MTPIEKLGDEIATLSAHIDAATHRMLDCIRQFDAAGGWNEQGAVSCAHWLSWRVGWDPTTAREKVRVARALGDLPGIDRAFGSATVSYAKVRALTRVATPENEERLLEMALVATAAQLERMCRGYRAAGRLENEPEERSVRRRLLPGGMVKLELVLQPDEADLILRAVERAREVPGETGEGSQPSEAAAKPTGQDGQSEPHHEPEEQGPDVSAEAGWPSRADGVVRLAESYLSGHPVSGNGGERFQVMVHLDRASLERLGVEQEGLAAKDQWAATLEDGTRVSPEAFRRVACDCGLLAVGRDGENLNIGRRSRSIPPAIRRALMVRDGGCVFPGCSHTRFLHAHHIKHWLHGGETRLENLAFLCTFHHHLVHEGGWTISRGGDTDGGFLFHSPDGKPVGPNPTPTPVEDIHTWMREWADEQNLRLGPDVNRQQWDGSRPDYDLAVSVLLEGG